MLYMLFTLVSLHVITTARARRTDVIDLRKDLGFTTFQTSGKTFANRQLFPIWAPEFVGLAKATAKPIDLESDAIMIEGDALRAPNCLRMTFEEAANRVATSISSEDKTLAKFQEFYTTVVAKVNATAKDCPECVNFVAATGQVFHVEHAWAIMSIVVNLVDILQTSNPTFKTITRKLCHLIVDGLANEKFFDWKACATKNLDLKFDLKCVLAMGTAYLNHAAAEYIKGMVAVMASINAEIIVVVKEIFTRGATGALLWKLFFNISRIFVFILVGLLKGKAAGQFADALILLGNLAVKRGAENLMTSLHESFKGLELDFISNSMYDSTLGSACADKLSMLLFDEPANLMIEAKLIHGIETVEDYLPFENWTASARLDSGRVLNAYLQRSTMHDTEPKEQWENWRWIQPRFKVLEKEDPIIASPPEARAMWACRLGERICRNKKKPQETHVAQPLSGDTWAIDMVHDIDNGWKVAMPWFHSCCISSGSCSLS